MTFLRCSGDIKPWNSKGFIFSGVPQIVFFVVTPLQGGLIKNMFMLRKTLKSFSSGHELFLMLKVVKLLKDLFFFRLVSVKFLEI